MASTATSPPTTATAAATRSPVEDQGNSGGGVESAVHKTRSQFERPSQIAHRPVGPERRRLPGRNVRGTAETSSSSSSSSSAAATTTAKTSASATARPTVPKSESALKLDRAVREALEARLHERKSTAEEDRRRAELEAAQSAMPAALVSDLKVRLQTRSSDPSTPERLQLSPARSRSPSRSQAHTLRLIRCFGKPRVFAVLVEPQWASLNANSAYVLDCSATKIYVWSGSQASMLEKAKASALATVIKDHERSTKAEVVQIDATASADDRALFWQTLGASSAAPPTIAVGGDGVTSTDAGNHFNEKFRLFELGSDDASSPREVAHPKGFLMGMLDHTCCYVLDTQTEVYLWLGSKTQAPLASAQAAAQRLFAATSRPAWMGQQAQRVSDGGEPLLFREKFADWPDLSHEQIQRRRLQRSPAPVTVPSPVRHTFTGSMLLERLHEALTGFLAAEDMPSDGTGLVQRILTVDGKGATHEVLEPSFGLFDMESSFIIIYKYLVSLADRYTVFLWQGKSASKLVLGAGSVAMTKIYDELRRTQFVNQQVLSDSEYDLHFRAIFKGRLVVGHNALSASYRGACRLLHVRGCPVHLHLNSPWIAASTFALEATASPSTLNTNDAFIALGGHAPSVWIGSACHPAVKDIALSIAQRLATGTSSSSSSSSTSSSASLQIVNEGSEPQTFWQLLGGSRDAYTARERRQPALFFGFSAKTGTLRPHPVLTFTQFDLDQEKPALLQSGALFYLWASRAVPRFDIEAALDMARDYATAWCNENGGEPNVTQVEAGREPVDFTRHFHGWKPSRTAAFTRVASKDFGVAYRSPVSPVVGGRVLPGAVSLFPLGVLPTLSSRSSQSSTPPASSASSSPSPSRSLSASLSSSSGASKPIYSYAELTSTSPPSGIDRQQMEQYLSDAEFHSIFACSKAEWEQYPAWKKLNKRKEAKLF